MVPILFLLRGNEMHYHIVVESPKVYSYPNIILSGQLSDAFMQFEFDQVIQQVRHLTGMNVIATKEQHVMFDDCKTEVYWYSCNGICSLTNIPAVRFNKESLYLIGGFAPVKSPDLGSLFSDNFHQTWVDFVTRDNVGERFLNKTWEPNPGKGPKPKILVKEIGESTLHVWCDSRYDLEIKSIAGVFNVTDIRKNVGYLSVMIDPRYDRKEIARYILHM